MSSLTDNEKLYLARILNMDSGYVLGYSDATYGEFFNRHGIDIHNKKYHTYGTSKAKKMRSFWEQESDILVGQILSEMLDSYETACKLNGKEVNAPVLKEARSIVGRLNKKSQGKKFDLEGEGEEVEAQFLHEEFIIPKIQKLHIEQAIIPIIESRLQEVHKTIARGAHLSTIIMCGSILEAVLLGRAQQTPRPFNLSGAAPKAKDGKVEEFKDWTLANFIDVASDIGILKPDVQKFSHGLRDFRNYIHPYQQLLSNFRPDKHTAKVCFQVLKAALADVAGERK